MNTCTAKYCQEMLAAGHKVYLYNFTYYNREQFGFFGMRMPFLAATHCHDLRYLLGKGLYSKFRPDYDDFDMMDTISTLWTNFAKYGDPNTADGPVEWKPLSTNSPFEHLMLDLEIETCSDYHNRRHEFWQRIEDLKAGLEPIPHRPSH